MLELACLVKKGITYVFITILTPMPYITVIIYHTPIVNIIPKSTLHAVSL